MTCQPLVRPRFVERLEATLAPVRGGIHADHVAVRACRLAVPSLLDQLAFEIGGNGVLQLLRLVVNLVPFQSEDLRQHTLDQMMAVQQPVGDLAARRRQRDLALGSPTAISPSRDSRRIAMVTAGAETSSQRPA